MRMTRPVDSSHVNLERVDLTDSHLYGEGDPHLIFHALRHRDPVHWQPVRRGLGFWSVTKHEDARMVLRDPAAFTSQRGTLLNILGIDDPAGGHQMAVTDPPRHASMRRPLQQAMTGPAVRAHGERLRQVARGLLAPAVTGEIFDFAAAMMLLSTAVAGTLMALPEEDWPRLTHLTTMAIAPDDPDYLLPEGSALTLQRAHREVFAYFQDVLSHRSAGGDDLISVLLSIEIDGKRLDPGDIISNCYSLVMGASVTSPHVPSSCLLELVETNGFADWAAQPDLLSSGIEEALRWASPANHFVRYATRDVDIRGVRIKAGEPLVIWLGSANRDEDVFSDPYRFDIRRYPNPPLAFGYGPHYCVGFDAARQTLHILFEELFQNFEGFDLAGRVTHLCSNFVAGITHLPVVAHPRPQARESLEPCLEGSRPTLVR